MTGEAVPSTGDSSTTSAKVPSPFEVEGFVEFANTFQLRGWVYARGATDKHLSVEAFIGDVRLVGGEASLFREDLAEAGIGDGHHAFVLNFDVALQHSDLENVAVYVRTPDHKLHLIPNIAQPAVEPPIFSKQPVFTVAAPSPASDPAQNPVFILGAQRSGTSAVTQALLRSGRYTGQEDGHLLGLAGQLIELVEHYYEVNEREIIEQRSSFIARVPKRYFIDSICGVFAHLASSAFPSGYWVDRTANCGMVQIAPLLKDIWPNAKFVFMKRRGIENLISHSREFSKDVFRERCEDWRNVMEAWVRVRRDLGADAIEVEQLDLVRNPQQIADNLVSFLNIPAAETINFREALISDRPERTSSNFGQVYDLDSTGWSAGEIKMFKEICGAMMAVYQYGYSKEYTFS